MALPTDTTIGTTLTPIGSPVLIERQSQVGIVVSNTGATAFNAFAVQRQRTPGGPWLNWLGSSDFGSAQPGQTTWIASQSPATLPADSYTDFTLLPGPCSAIQFLASVASGTTTANIAVNTIDE